jgi:hypothetical protein
MTRLLLLLPCFFVSLSGCGGGDKTARSDAAGSPGTVSNGGATATTIHVVIGGGKHAGTYDAKSSEITCTHGFAGPGSWGNQYSVTGKKADEFSSLQLIVPDTKDAADGTDKFLVTVAFGELLQPSFTDYTINTQGGSKKAGSGTVTVDDRGKTGKVVFKGKTAEGVTLEGTIDCHQLMRGQS